MRLTHTISGKNLQAMCAADRCVGKRRVDARVGPMYGVVHLQAATFVQPK